jgi:hypothetical protein
MWPSGPYRSLRAFVRTLSLGRLRQAEDPARTDSGSVRARKRRRSGHRSSHGSVGLARRANGHCTHLASRFGESQGKCGLAHTVRARKEGEGLRVAVVKFEEGVGASIEVHPISYRPGKGGWFVLFAFAYLPSGRDGGGRHEGWPGRRGGTARELRPGRGHGGRRRAGEPSPLSSRDIVHPSAPKYEPAAPGAEQLLARTQGRPSGGLRFGRGGMLRCGPAQRHRKAHEAMTRFSQPG